MKVLILGTFAAGLLLSPVLLLQTMVMPELDKMKYTYSHMDELANNVVEDKSSSSTSR